MRLPKSVSNILVKQQPQLQRFVQRNGSITVKLKRSIYGLKQAAADWYTEISRQLTSVCHYSVSTVDTCLFYKSRHGLLSIICLHVDDLLVISQSPQEIGFLKDKLSRAYGNIEFDHAHVSYLGMELSTLPDKSIEVKQTGYAA